MAVLGSLPPCGSCLVLRRSCSPPHSRVTNLSWFVISLKIDSSINIWDKLGRKGEKNSSLCQYLCQHWRVCSIYTIWRSNLPKKSQKSWVSRDFCKERRRVSLVQYIFLSLRAAHSKILDLHTSLYNFFQLNNPFLKPWSIWKPLLAWVYFVMCAGKYIRKLFKK